MQKDPEYTDLMEEIIDYFRISIRLAKKFGIPEEMLIIDPGIGFGKTFDHNLELINNLDKLSILKRPILVGPSRKAFLGRILDNAPASERLEGTSAECAVSIMKGANILRVHDVKEIAKVAKVVDAIKRERVV
jgi:dihydropteroate synthase